MDCPREKDLSKENAVFVTVCFHALAKECQKVVEKTNRPWSRREAGAGGAGGLAAAGPRHVEPRGGGLPELALPGASAAAGLAVCPKWELVLRVVFRDCFVLFPSFFFGGGGGGVGAGGHFGGRNGGLDFFVCGESWFGLVLANPQLCVCQVHGSL